MFCYFVMTFQPCCLLLMTAILSFHASVSEELRARTVLNLIISLSLNEYVDTDNFNCEKWILNLRCTEPIGNLCGFDKIQSGQLSAWQMHTVSVGIHVCSPVLTTKGPSFTVVCIFRAKFEVAQIPEISLKEETHREGGGIISFQCLTLSLLF